MQTLKSSPFHFETKTLLFLKIKYLNVKIDCGQFLGDYMHSSIIKFTFLISSFFLASFAFAQVNQTPSAEIVPSASLGSCGAPVKPSGGGGPPISLQPIVWVKDSSKEIHTSHIVELRQNIDSRRIQCGLPATTWTNNPPITSGNLIYASHINELRSSIQDLYSSQSQKLPTLTDSKIVSGKTIISEFHIAELKVALDQLKTCVIASTCPGGMFLSGGICLPNSRVLNINKFRGRFINCIGAYKKCVLTQSVYDGDGIGFCGLLQDPNTLAWASYIGDEGKKVPQRCTFACSNNDIGNKPGDTCKTSKGYIGVIDNRGKCCNGLINDPPARKNDMVCE